MARESRAIPPDRARLLEQVDAARQRRRAATEVILDASASAQERIAAARVVGTVADPDASRRLFQLVIDENEDPELRGAVLESQAAVVATSEALIDQTLAQLRDPSEPPPVRRAAIAVLQTASINSHPAFRSRQPAYVDVIRGLLNDADRTLADLAMRYLALLGDEIVQQRLVRSLEDRDDTVAPPEVAIQLLSYDLHANHLPILREYARQAPSVRARKAAIRNLGADPESANLLADVATSSDEDPELRHAATVSLAALQPARARDAARRVVLDPHADGELRTAMLNTLIHSSETRAAVEDASFAERLAAMPKRELPSQFRDVYARFLRNNRRP